MSTLLVTPASPQTIRTNQLSITIGASLGSFEVGAPTPGLHPTLALTQSLKLTPTTGALLASSSSTLDDALKAAGLEEAGTVQLNNIASDNQASFKVDAPDATPLFAVKYVDGQAQMINKDTAPVGTVATTSYFSIPLESTPAPTASLLSANALSSIGGVIVKIFKYVGAPIVRDIVARFERDHKTQQLLRCVPVASPLQVAGQDWLNQLGENRTLLLVHGIFSSIESGFKGLLQNGTYMQQLQQVYDDRIIGWDHWTVSQDTSGNAFGLVEALPPNAQLDVVCHSRGALVLRSLLEDPKTRQAFQDKNITIHKVIFVAGAFNGDMIASNNDAILTGAQAIVRLCSLDGANAAADMLALALKIFVAAAQVVQDLPGIGCLAPDGAYIANTAWTRSAYADLVYYYIRAAYSPGGSLVDEVLDHAVDDAIGDKQNDYVVPFKGAGLGATKNAVAGGYDIVGPGGGPQSRVYHTCFFQQPDVQGYIAHWLYGAPLP